MRKTIQRAFDVIMADRVDDVSYRKLATSEVYETIDTQVEGLEQLLIDSLTQHSQKALFEEFKSLSSKREYKMIELAYRQGLEDSMEIQKELSALGIVTQYKGGF